MKLFSFSLRSSAARMLLPLLFLLLPFATANAGGADQQMRAALGELIVAKNLEASLANVLAGLPTEGLALAKEAAQRKMTDELGMPEAEQAHMMALLDELAPQMFAQLSAEVGKMDQRALLIELLESVYPAYFSAVEVRALAAIYAHPAYDKAAAVAAQVIEEQARTGKDPELLWTELGAQLGDEEKRYAVVMKASPELRKEQELQARIEADFGVAFGRRVRPMLVRAFDDTHAAARARMAASRPK